MTEPTYHIPAEETLDGPALGNLQRTKLGRLIARVRATNRFYQAKLAGIDFDPATDCLSELPLTTRGEIEQDQTDHPPYGTNLTDPLDRYCRLHQTSGTTGRPVRWLDTAETWDWFKRCWGIIFTAAGVTRADRIMFPFSFGPFVGFWAAFDGAVAMGNLALAAGGMTTSARLRFMFENDVTTVCCTPTYAMRLAEVADEEGIDLRKSGVRRLIVAGEPGGSIPETRRRIESAWDARVFDHTGMTEIGPLGFECEQAPGGVHLIESECIPEVIDPATLRPVPDGEFGELVLTNLGRCGSPLIRYRTGDRVKLSRGRCACGRCFARIIGGIQGRIDDMFIVRGNNVFPAALESVIRRFEQVAEYRVQIDESASLTRVSIDLETRAESDDLVGKVAEALHDTLHFRAEVRTVPPGTLPRFEMKARRIVRKKAEAGDRKSEI